MMDQFLWVIFPYLALAVFIGGHIFRYNYDQFGWTAKSSEVLEKKKLRWGSLLFHWGILFVLAGHIMGILIPAGVYEAIGVSEYTYHYIAIAGGLPAGIAAALGLAIFIYRRYTVKRVRRTSSIGDWAALFFLAVVMGSGLSATFANIDSHGFDYRTTIGPWFRGLFVLSPDASLMETVPLWFKIHITAAFGLFAAWPFTRLVHFFSIPLRYLRRSYIVYRKREPIGTSKKVS
ncbi:respiratory nitrate reductase subunit gamma [Bacillus marinisedimentorum]|uniref:respiratory nitrate reductase subunit gamma n=1 Tax=Bacillus marinisedimentorum TaxID=1821260 RepID=UPI000872F091|nr:respiratory nitrate reductase subunit gamma [Bacillus marinisedimentorum]